MTSGSDHYPFWHKSPHTLGESRQCGTFLPFTFAALVTGPSPERTHLRRAPVQGHSKARVGSKQRLTKTDTHYVATFARRFEIYGAK